MLFNEPKLLKCERYADLARRDARVSVLFNEPKLLKSQRAVDVRTRQRSFSALQRAEIAEIREGSRDALLRLSVSVLFNEPKLLK